MALNGLPLTDDGFEWAGVADDIRPTVQEWLDLCDRVATSSSTWSIGRRCAGS
jgi:hypothetical protein